MPVSAISFIGACTTQGPVAPHCAPPRPDKVVIVVEENHGYDAIIGNPDAAYINRLAREGANFTASYAVTHPSQPNYLALFSGSTYGLDDDDMHPHELFAGPNLGSKLLSAGYTFVGYSEGLPQVGWDGDADDSVDSYYRRKHNPWVNWQYAHVPLPPNKLPPETNQPFTNWPGDFANLPDVSIVVPDQMHDMHDGSVAEADAWLEQNIGPFVEWAQAHNGLLILTFDEDDANEFNRIVTIFHGPMIVDGEFAEPINHYSVLRTIEEMYGLPHDGGTLGASGVPCEVWGR